MASMSKEEYDRMMGRKPVADVVLTNGTMIDHKVYPNGDTPESDEAIEDDSQMFTGYQRRFVQTNWQTTDIYRLLHRRYDKEHQGSANWSEMGCYKTSTGLWLIDKLMKERGVENPNILIVTSKAGKGTFFDAIPEILPEYTIVNVETQRLSLYRDKQMLPLNKDFKFVPGKFTFPCFCIAHYNIFARSNFGKFESDEKGLPITDDKGNFVFMPFIQCDYIVDREWDFMWCDEFHRMKDKGSKWTVNIKKVKTTVGRHGSTGTGFINRPDEIWSLLNWLDKANYPSYWAFREEFCEVDDETGYSRVIGCRPEKKDEFRNLVRNIVVRRELSNVMPHIKEPIFMPIDIELNAAQRKMYNEIKTMLAAEDQKGTPLFAANVLSMLQRLRQICVATPEVVEDYFDPVLGRRYQKIRLVEPSSKLDELMKIVDGLQWDEDKKEPLVVFSNFKDPLTLFKARLDKHNEVALEMGMESEIYKYIHLDVNDSDDVRYRKWHDDFPTMEYRIFMTTLQLGSESINLTPARHAVFLDRSWSPKDNSQGIGRIRRPGQEGQPIVIHINAIDTTDQYVELVNDMKSGWFNAIFGKDAK